MAVSVPSTRTAPRVTTTERQHPGWMDNLITILAGLWLMVGLFIDGWAHNNLDGSLETFFTPWHAIFYSGFTAAAGWLSWLVVRNLRAGHTGAAAIPVGYELGLAGVVLFGAGGAGDMLWHTIFGIEVGTEALLSPTHLLLFLGGMLILTSPWRAMWARGPRAMSFGAFFPALLSITLSTAFVAFMHMYLWPQVNVLHSAELMARLDGGQRWHVQNLALADILIGNAILMAPLLLALRRWRLPFGSITFVLGVVTLMMTAMTVGVASAPLTLAGALVTGLVADAASLYLRPNTSRLGLSALATLVPLVLWSLHFLAVALRGGTGLSIELWTGITIMSGLSGLALSALVAPPPIPAETAAA